jgi:hypothetical protein
MTRKQLAEILLSDETKLQEQVVYYDYDISSYAAIDEVEQ